MFGAYIMAKESELWGFMMYIIHIIYLFQITLNLILSSLVWQMNHCIKGLKQILILQIKWRQNIRESRIMYHQVRKVDLVQMLLPVQHGIIQILLGFWN